MNPLLAELAAAVWAMDPAALTRFLSVVESIPPSAFADVVALFGPESDDEEPAGYEVIDGVAHIPITGPIMRQVPALLRYFGIDATGTVATEAAIHAALADSNVDAIVLDVDSPGGTVTGLQELGETIREAREVKPIVAHNGGAMMSAAYWLASQAGRVSSGALNLTGSIGVYFVAHDSSRAAESAGVKVHVISSHELKGAGVPGAPLSQSQIDDMQRIVDQYTGAFVDAVADGRGMSVDVVREHATGQVWIGADAQSRGLIDAVETAAEAHSYAANQSIGEFAPASIKPAQADKEIITMAEANDQAVELEALRAKLAEAEAKATEREAEIAAKEKAIAEAFEASKRSLIEANRDRITPAMRGAVQGFAAKCDDIASLDAFIKALPVATRAEAEGIGEGVENVDAPEDEIDDGDVAVARALGVSLKMVRAAGNVASVTCDGRFLLRDGSIVTKEELL